MKLNYKRTILVGFAFFLISAFWQAYDTIIPLMLTNKFGLDQTWSGLIMSLDNILALFMLPLFGALSDKKETRFGKRTPFIVIGAIVAIVCFVGLTFADNAQLNKISEGTKETYWNENYTVENREYHNITNKDVLPTYTVRDYAARVYFNKEFDELNETQKTELENWYKNDELNYDTVYVYNKSDNTYRLQRNKRRNRLYERRTIERLGTYYQCLLFVGKRRRSTICKTGHKNKLVDFGNIHCRAVGAVDSYGNFPQSRSCADARRDR